MKISLDVDVTKKLKVSVDWPSHCHKQASSSSKYDKYYNIARAIIMIATTNIALALALALDLM